MRREFELSNHLGNVLVTLSDKKLQVQNGTTGVVGYYNADVITATDYYPGGMMMPGRKYSQPNSNYRYGFNGKENDNEVKGEGNSYDFGARMYDPRTGRWLSVDPHESSYPHLSGYSGFANNPIIYIDPDGKDIILAAGLTTEQKLKVLGTMQKLTNDKLVYNTLKDGTTQIKIANLGKGNKNAGTNLIRRLNSSDKTATIQFGNEWLKKNVNDATNNAKNGVGSDVIVDFAPGHLPNLPVLDPKTGIVSDEISNEVTNFGHELIHAERAMRGEQYYSSEKGTHTFKDGKGKTITNTQPKEELATTGVGGYNKKKDITENDLRKEQGKKKRATY